MGATNIVDVDYKKWLIELKSKIRSAQLKAAMVVNSQLIAFYWDLGKMISKKQSETKWGEKLIDRVAKDLKSEFPGMKGLPRSNLFYAKQFYLFYQSSIVQQAVGQIGEQDVSSIVQRSVGQIPWGHNIFIFNKSTTISEAQFYLQQTLENQWSRENLALQIKSAIPPFQWRKELKKLFRNPLILWHMSGSSWFTSAST